VNDAKAGAHPPADRRDPRFDARCQLCGRVAGQVVGGNFLHHPDCRRTPALAGGLPRCCDCGGRVYLEATDGPMLSAADREAARHSRPGHA
jgi:hypothetical protein